MPKKDKRRFRHVTVEDDVIVENEPHLPSEVEDFYRNIVREELKILHHVGARDKALTYFSRGARWGLQGLLAHLGHAELAESILTEEMDDYLRKMREDGGFWGNVQSKIMDATAERMVIPGNRLTASVGKGTTRKGWRN